LTRDILAHFWNILPCWFPAATPDGRRFLVVVDEQGVPLFLPDLRVVFNWFDELNARFER